MPDDEERFFFVHLQKTAGTSLRIRLQHQFGEAAVYRGGAKPGPPGGLLRSVA